MDVGSVRSYIDNKLYSRVSNISGASIGYASINYNGSYFYCDIGINITSRSIMSSVERQLDSIFREIRSAVSPYDVRYSVGFVVL